MVVGEVGVYVECFVLGRVVLQFGEDDGEEGGGVAGGGGGVFGEYFGVVGYACTMGRLARRIGVWRRREESVWVVRDVLEQLCRAGRRCHGGGSS